MAKAILSRMNHVRDITLSDLKLHYGNIVLKPSWYCHRNRPVSPVRADRARGRHFKRQAQKRLLGRTLTAQGRAPRTDKCHYRNLMFLHNQGDHQESEMTVPSGRKIFLPPGVGGLDLPFPFIHPLPSQGQSQVLVCSSQALYSSAASCSLLPRG